MPRRVFTFLPDQGLDFGNLISSIGAILMGVGAVILVVNIIVTTIKGEKVNVNDPWGDGRTMDWAIASPPPVYNFKQIPLVRGYDTWWLEKMEGNKELPPSEPLQDIHMPNGSIIPIFISLGLFIAGFGAMYVPSNVVGDGSPWGTVFLIVGLVITFGSMLLRSLRDDLGYYIPKKDLVDDVDRGGKAI